MWTFSGVASEIPFRARAAVVALASLALAACGPGGGGGGAITYDIVFAIDETPDALETLAFSVAYTGGNFVGSGSTVSCTLLNDDDDETADFDDDDTGTLTVDIDATDNPMEEGLNIVACDFQAPSPPDAADFTITVDDADPADPEEVTVSVESTGQSAAATNAGEEAE